MLAQASNLRSSARHDRLGHSFCAHLARTMSPDATLDFLSSLKPLLSVPSSKPTANH